MIEIVMGLNLAHKFYPISILQILHFANINNFVAVSLRNQFLVN